MNHRGWDRLGRDGFARAASILGADMTMDEELRWLHIELFADIFTDLDQIGTARFAATAVWLVAMLDAR